MHTLHCANTHTLQYVNTYYTYYAFYTLYIDTIYTTHSYYSLDDKSIVKMKIDSNSLFSGSFQHTLSKFVKMTLCTEVTCMYIYICVLVCYMFYVCIYGVTICCICVCFTTYMLVIRTH